MGFSDFDGGDGDWQAHLYELLTSAFDGAERSWDISGVGDFEACAAYLGFGICSFSVSSSTELSFVHIRHPSRGWRYLAPGHGHLREAVRTYKCPYFE